MKSVLFSIQPQGFSQHFSKRRSGVYLNNMTVSSNYKHALVKSFNVQLNNSSTSMFQAKTHQSAVSKPSTSNSSVYAMS